MNDRVDKLSKVWKNSIDRTPRIVSLNFRKLVKEILNEKRSDAYTHWIHYYPGKMLPYIPLFFLSLPDIIPEEGIILDPFCGSGTVLLESIVHPFFKRTALGIEVNPLGRLIAKVKTTPLSINKINKRYEEIVTNYQTMSYELTLPEKTFSYLLKWFPRSTLKELIKLKNAIDELHNDDYKDFFWICFSSIIRKFSFADPFIPPPVLINLKRYKITYNKYRYLVNHLNTIRKPKLILDFFSKKVQQNISRMKNLTKVNEVKKKIIKAEIIWDDVREIRIGKLSNKGRIIKLKAPKMKDESVDGIITSPPYLSAQKYVRTLKLELLLLNICTIEDLIDLEKKTIGTEYISRKEDIDKIGISEIDTLIESIYEKHPERGIQLYTYLINMKLAIQEIYRILKDGRCLILVLGTNKILNQQVNVYRLITKISEDIGFSHLVTFRDKITNRGMITKRHETGGLIQNEYIVVLRRD